MDVITFCLSCMKFWADRYVRISGLNLKQNEVEIIINFAINVGAYDTYIELMQDVRENYENVSHYIFEELKDLKED